MSETVGDFLLARLAGEWGVERIYGYPGDGIDGIKPSWDLRALRPSSDLPSSRKRCIRDRGVASPASG